MLSLGTLIRYPVFKEVTVDEHETCVDLHVTFIAPPYICVALEDSSLLLVKLWWENIYTLYSDCIVFVYNNTFYFSVITIYFWHLGHTCTYMRADG